MSILDKPLTPQPHRSKRRLTIIILSIVAVLLIALFVFTDIHADLAFVVHFATAPNHFTYQGHSDYVSAVAWSPDGKRIATGGIGNVEVLDLATGNLIASYGYNAAIVHALAWSPDGRYIAVGSSTEMVQIWDLVTGQNIFNYRGHSGDVLSVAWSPDGKRIVSGSSDGTAQVWNALTGNDAYTYRGHADYNWGHLTSGASVNAVAWSPDGKRIASGSNDMSVQVWQAK